MPGFEVIGAEERDAITRIFDQGGGVLFRHGFESIRRGQYAVASFEREFATFMGTRTALAVSSGTAALRLAMAAMNLKPGARVGFPAFTFVAVAEAIIESGLTPVCLDVDDSLNLSAESLELQPAGSLDALVVVHMLGHCADLRAIKDVCDRRGIPIIEDCAWVCGGSLDGKRLGTHGRIGIFSFDYAKTITTGEGGMLVFANESDESFARAWHDHGHENNPKLPRWEDSRQFAGFNYRMSELQGAVGRAQLQKLPAVIAGHQKHHDLLVGVFEQYGGVSVRRPRQGSIPTCDAFVFSLPTSAEAASLKKLFTTRGIPNKILPDAFTWHFAGTWNHMPELRFGLGVSPEMPSSKTGQILKKSLALPVTALDPSSNTDLVRRALVDFWSGA